MTNLIQPKMYGALIDAADQHAINRSYVVSAARVGTVVHMAVRGLDSALSLQFATEAKAADFFNVVVFGE